MDSVVKRCWGDRKEGETNMGETTETEPPSSCILELSCVSKPADERYRDMSQVRKAGGGGGGGRKEWTGGRRGGEKDGSSSGGGGGGGGARAERGSLYHRPNYIPPPPPPPPLVDKGASQAIGGICFFHSIILKREGRGEV